MVLDNYLLFISLIAMSYGFDEKFHRVYEMQEYYEKNLHEKSLIFRVPLKGCLDRVRLK